MDFLGEEVDNMGRQEGGTLILVGHDTELDALATLFGLAWNTHPFPRNATTPGSALRFDVDHSKVTASVHYQTFEPGSNEVHTAPAEFTWWAFDESSPSLLNISLFMAPRLNSTCAPP